jgi:hypothetical protein
MNPDLVALVDEWYMYHSQLAEATAFLNKEKELRKQVFNALFPSPEEGTNHLTLPDGTEIKAVYKLNRTLDEAPLASTLQLLRERGFDADSLVTWKPSLVLGAYRKLDGTTLGIFNSVVTTKPALPTLEIKLPSKGEPE